MTQPQPSPVTRVADARRDDGEVQRRAAAKARARADRETLRRLSPDRKAELRRLESGILAGPKSLDPRDL